MVTIVLLMASLSEMHTKGETLVDPETVDEPLFSVAGMAQARVRVQVQDLQTIVGLNKG